MAAGWRVGATVTGAVTRAARAGGREPTPGPGRIARRMPLVAAHGRLSGQLWLLMAAVVIYDLSLETGLWGLSLTMTCNYIQLYDSV